MTTGRIIACSALLLLVGAVSRAPGWAQAGASGGRAGGASTLFERQCYSCHNIGGGSKKGPDLAGLLQRRSRAWLHKYIVSPGTLKAAGDPTTVKLFKDFAPEVMPDQMLSAEQIDQLLDFIDGLSKSGKAFVPASGGLKRKPTRADIAQGHQYFTGQRRLAAGGPPCISCHSVSGVGALDGGTLGPDLTQANLRYTDVELAGIIKAPAFPTMAKLFEGKGPTDEEVVKLFAYLQSAKNRPPEGSRATLADDLFGIAGALLALGLINYTWRGRLRGASRLPRKGAR